MWPKDPPSFNTVSGSVTLEYCLSPKSGSSRFPAMQTLFSKRYKEAWNGSRLRSKDPKLGRYWPTTAVKATEVTAKKKVSHGLGPEATTLLTLMIAGDRARRRN